MIQPVEMRQTLPMTLHGGFSSTTTEVWEMLTAARDGDLARVTELTTKRPELATCQFNYTPPLHFAVREGHLPVVRALVAQGAFDPDYKAYPFGDTLLTMAEDRGYDGIARVLRDALSRPGLSRKWTETGEIDFGQDEGRREFEKSVHAGKYRKVERFLNDRPELALDELSSWGEGVLMMPAKRSDRSLLELLMRFGARVPAMSKWGRFYYFRHDDIAAFLLDKGMSSRHMTWHEVTLLHDMAQAGDVKKAALLLDRGADINAIDDEYRSTPLGMAARWGHDRMVTFLLDRGADPNKAGADWSRPFAWAKRKGHSRIADALVAAGAVARS
ncbi:MAG TPA: ankyrin repeat domain-containing protein [Vicinamibacterales bacterium]|nr:ankyrin repeat domain-containing protein [Vicinamibacterales bacterium]